MSSPILPIPSGQLAKDMLGVWWLLTREDGAGDGRKMIDPTLGADPIGILTYASTHFAAQFMKRDRTVNAADDVSYSGKNNTVAVGGYDAYFGTYEVNEETGRVTHTLLGSITPANTGISVTRDLRVNGDTLMIQIETTTAGGEPITRTLTWKRIT